MRRKIAKILILSLVIGALALPMSSAYAAWQTQPLSGPSVTSTNYYPLSIATDSEFTHVVWYNTYDGGNMTIHYRRSSDYGATFDSVIPLTNNTYPSEQPSIAADSGKVHLTWTENSSGVWSVAYKNSLNNGTSWSSKSILSSSSYASYTSDVAVESNDVHMVWVTRLSASQYVLYYNKSNNDGSTWGTATQILNRNTQVYNPSIAVDSGTVHVTWVENYSGSYRLFYKRSTDNGTSWSSPVELDSSVFEITWCGHPEITADSGRVHIVWMDRTSTWITCYIKSNDNGATWPATISVFTEPGHSGYYPSVSADSGQVFISHLYYDTIEYSLYLERSSDNGDTWENTEFVTNPVIPVFTAIDSYAGTAHIVYKNNDTQEFVYLTNSPSITNVSPLFCSSGTTVVTIEGSNFEDGATVKIGGYYASNVAFESASKLRAAVPIIATSGTYSVSVINPDNAIAVKSGAIYVEADNQAPDPITDFHATAVSNDYVTIQWTAPGDDDNVGTADSYQVRVSTDPLPFDWNAAGVLATGVVPAPLPAGSTQSFTQNGLTDNTTYHFAIKTTDDAGNVSGISNICTFTTTDGTPPSAISDLRVISSAPDSVTLAWTVPGDDGMTGGRAEVYDIRYSSSPVFDFASANNVVGEPDPQNPNTTQTLTISPLSPGTEYNFAMTTMDESNNISDLSNILNFTTDIWAYTVSGQITGLPAEKLAEGVLVTLESSPVMTLQSFDGTFTFADVPEGTHTLTAQKIDGYLVNPESLVLDVSQDILNIEFAYEQLRYLSETGARNHPNPFDPTEGETTIIFDADVDEVKLNLYTMGGDLVWHTTAVKTGTHFEVPWNGKSTGGAYVSNGNYIYLIVSNGEILERGQLVVWKTRR